jgi:2-C-methyl-D-erythritol 4-phosphate cytidylyltransferase
MSDAPNTTVLIPAAGRGTRLGGKRKQLRRLGDAPVLVQTLRAFERCAAVEALVVAGPPGHTEALRRELGAAALAKLRAVVEGGASRQASVRRALESAPNESEIILVHDAVRPFVPAERIRSVVEAVRAHDAAALGVPVSDTLRRVGRDGRFGETVDRDGCFRMQTPQGFRRALLADAFAQAADEKETPATDCAGLVQAAGHDVHVVEGDHHNFKITTPADWQLAEALWPRWVEGLKVECCKLSSSW